VNCSPTRYENRRAFCDGFGKSTSEGRRRRSKQSTYDRAKVRTVLPSVHLTTNSPGQFALGDFVFAVVWFFMSRLLYFVISRDQRGMRCKDDHEFRARFV
jgi:hypothetical protein